MILKRNIAGLHFQPWIGENYGQEDRLLLLGESHYMDEEPDGEDDFSSGYHTLTNDVVNNFLENVQMKTLFFERIGLLFHPNDPSKIWEEAAFANLLQIGLKDAQSQPTQREIETIKPAFKLLLNALKPKKVIVFSRRMWNYWVPEDTGENLLRLEGNGKWTTVWKYKYDGGECLVTGVVSYVWQILSSMETAY